MKQTSFASLEYAGKKRKTRREKFLGEMQQVVPWPGLIALIEPHYPSSGRVGRPPIGVPRMLRMYFLQQWYSLSDEGLIPKGLLSEAALAWVITSKYLDGLPLYRQAALLGRFGGTELSRNTLAASVVRVGQATQPVINLMRDALLDSFIVHGDETEVQVLKEPGRVLDAHLVIWARRKYKRMQKHRNRAWEWLKGLQSREPRLFPHWWSAIRTTG